MDQAIDWIRYGRCLRPALSSLRDGARRAVSTLRASIAIAWGCDIERKEARGLWRSLVFNAPLVILAAWMEGSSAAWIIAFIGSVGMCAALVCLRAAEAWRAAAYHTLDVLRELAEGDAHD